MSNADIVRKFVQSWSNLDPGELASYFTENGCYYNMPFQRIEGRQAIEQFIAEFLKTWTKTEWDILNLVEAGDVVICERLDRIASSSGDVNLPCVGVFEMENGKIREWRDYFDLSTYMNAMTS